MLRARRLIPLMAQSWDTQGTYSVFLRLQVATQYCKDFGLNSEDAMILLKKYVRVVAVSTIMLGTIRAVQLFSTHVC